jgi:hypothetical protein
MRSKIVCLALAAALLPAAASAQDRGRAGRVADEVARTIEDTARAVGQVRDSLNRGINDVRWRGPERSAIDACRGDVERYGAMRVDHVRPYKSRSFRVYGTTDGYRGYGSRGYGPRSFTCTVREDGRVKVKTKRLRRY